MTERDRKSRGSNQLRRHDRTGGLPRTKAIGEISSGTVVGIWTIFEDAPTRNAAGRLCWNVQCQNGHVMSIEHASLSRSATPSQCTHCASEARDTKIAEAARAKEIVAEGVAEMKSERKARHIEEERATRVATQERTAA